MRIPAALITTLMLPLYGGSELDGIRNVYYGEGAGSAVAATTTDCTFIGYKAGEVTATAANDMFIGIFSGYHNVTGSDNAFAGARSGYYNATGSENTYVGTNAGYNNFVGNGNVFLGNDAGYNEMGSNLLYVANSDTNTPLLYGMFDTATLTVHGDLGIGTKAPEASLDVRGDAKLLFSEVTTSGNGLKNLVVLTNTNPDTDYISDAGFQVENGRENFRWNFRTAENYDEGFMVTKEGTGGAELVLANGTTDFANVILTLGNGAWCDGTWHDASSRTLKQDVKTLAEDAAMAALSGLEPVTYAYKAHPEDAKVGFIAEDVPELVADPARKSISAVDIVAVLTRVVKTQQEIIETQREKVTSLEARLANVERLLAAVEGFDAAQNSNPLAVGDRHPFTHAVVDHDRFAESQGPVERLHDHDPCNDQ